MNAYAKEWISPAVVQPGFYFAPAVKYTHPYNDVMDCLQKPPNAPGNNPAVFTIQWVRDYINKNVQPVDNPQIYRMHQNAEITYRLNETNNILLTLLSMQPKEGGATKGGITREETVLQKARAMLARLPEDFQLKTTVKQILLKMDPSNAPDCKDKKPRPPLNIFLDQELQRMQKVLTLVKTTLKDLDLAIGGSIIMSEHLQDALDAIYDSRVPKKWLQISWELSALGTWTADLQKRCQQY